MFVRWVQHTLLKHTLFCPGWLAICEPCRASSSSSPRPPYLSRWEAVLLPLAAAPAVTSNAARQQNPTPRRCASAPLEHRACPCGPVLCCLLLVCRRKHGRRAFQDRRCCCCCCLCCGEETAARRHGSAPALGELLTPCSGSALSPAAAPRRPRRGVGCSVGRGPVPAEALGRQGPSRHTRSREAAIDMHTEVLRAELPSLSCQTASGSYMLQLRDWWLHCRFSHGIGIQKNIRGGVARYDPSSSSCSDCSRAVHVGNPLAADGTARRSLQPAMPALWAERCMPTRIPDKILPACHNERRGERRWREGGRRARRLLRAR